LTQVTNVTDAYIDTHAEWWHRLCLCIASCDKIWHLHILSHVMTYQQWYFSNGNDYGNGNNWPGVNRNGNDAHLRNGNTI